MSKIQARPSAPDSALTRLWTAARNLRDDRRGGGFVEYAIVVGVVALLGITIFSGFRGKIKSAVTNQGTAVESLGSGLPTAK